MSVFPIMDRNNKSSALKERLQAWQEMIMSNILQARRGGGTIQTVSKDKVVQLKVAENVYDFRCEEYDSSRKPDQLAEGGI